MRRKTAEMGPRKEVVYGEDVWENLKHLRAKAAEVLTSLKKFDIDGVVFGSVARGDVKPTSDIDIFIPQVISSMRAGLALEGYFILGRSIVQATPRALIKSHIELEDNITVTFPLITPRESEIEFYLFGGEIDLQGILKEKRVCGVDKRLMFIEPTPEGHIETPLSDMSPGLVAKKLGVSQKIVEERMRVLERRADIGRTGIYMERPLAPDESVEQVFQEMLDSDPAMRRRAQSNM
ncbi:nucleotidyltransferase [Methanocella sp. CWC-04]|uniref:Nucleotidyltransferase n=1 Tax=Methanooceanicella nereidis TaxID=2052831 RepID=A0AAP2RCX0_9EURY|nr:nucleotidyltransferase domain-containing protein [Methanocella sp. CWC-04]MCD1294576.1 nucleotidyltransferase [Methanocella sp. CWC-04]